MSLSKTVALLRHERARSVISFFGLSGCHKTYYPVPSFLVRSFCSSPETNYYLSESDSTSTAEEKNKKPLPDFFREAVGLAPIAEDFDDGSGTSGSDLSRTLRLLELEIRELKEKDSILKKYGLAADKKEKTRRVEELETEVVVVDDMKDTIASSSSLSALFTEKDEQRRKPNVRKEASLNKDEKSMEVNRRRQAPAAKDDQANRRKVAPILIKELSPDMEVFLTHLNKEGYFSDANFLKNGTLDLSCFNDSYSRDFIKFAAENFGKDHQEIAKWLSGSELKKVALFGCPTTVRKNVFAAKKMRVFFSIAEDTVCSKCVMRKSCKFVNQSVWRSDTKNLNLASVMRVITLYALNLVPPELILTDELKMSVNRLLRDVINLSNTTSPVQLRT